MDSKQKYEALFDVNSFATAFVFVTSQYMDDKLMTEYFLLIKKRNGDIIYDGKNYYYGNDYLKLLCPEKDSQINFALEEVKSTASFELISQYYKNIPQLYLYNKPDFQKASLSFLAQNLPEVETKEVRNILRTQNSGLKKFLSNVYAVKRSLEIYDFPNN